MTQGSFAPLLLVAGIKKDSATLQIVRASGAFARNVLGKGQNNVAFAFFKPVEPSGDRIAGQRFRRGTTGAPILEALPAFVECCVRTVVDEGNHTVVVGLVVDAGVARVPDGRADEATLWLEDLGEKRFCGGWTRECSCASRHMQRRTVEDQGDPRCGLGCVQRSTCPRVTRTDQPRS